MDQAQNADLKVAQELISRLTREVTDLRNENTQLQSQLTGASTEGEGAGGSTSKSYDDLLEEIDELKGELNDRPSQEEVDELQEKIQKHRDRKREWRASTEYLSDRLDEAESGRRKQEGLRQNLEWAVEQLRKDLKDMAREKTEVLARLESQKPDNFDVREFLRGGLGESVPRPEPITVTPEEERTIKAAKDTYVFPTKEAGVIKWADKGGRFMVSLPSVIYNGKTQLTEPFRGNILTGLSYEVFGEDGHNVYYGTYRCIKKVAVDWEVLTSFGQEFVKSFFRRVVVKEDFVAPVVISLIQHMYEAGTLKAECFAFQC